MKRVADEMPVATREPTLFDRPVATLELRPVIAVQHLPNESLDIRFEHWLEVNPHVLDAFIHFAIQAQRAGAWRIGAKFIVERMRWEWMERTTGSDFKIDNNFTSRLARAAVGRRPDLEPLFEFRELRS